MQYRPSHLYTPNVSTTSKMKNAFIIILILLNLKNVSFGQTMVDTLKAKAENNQNPDKWNVDLFEKDKVWLNNNNSKPIKSLPFPVEKYDTYEFSNVFNFKIDNSNFSGVSFGENIGGREGKMKFKHDICLIFFTSDSIVSINNTSVSSRNFPYITIQGTLKLNEQFDFVGVKSPDNKGFLMVSMKAFDLQFGCTVVIFPNDDGSFYYLQVTERPITNEDFNDFISRLRINDKIKSMTKYVTKK